MPPSRPPSPPSRTALLLDQVEKTVNSPSTFTPSTPHLVLAPLLAELRSLDDDDGRISLAEDWCRHLADPTSAAEARDTVRSLLAEVEDWDDWRWDEALACVDEKRARIEGIKATLSTLPIEWLKARVTRTSSDYRC